MDHKPLPIGVENFEDMITNEYYYVDKSLFIKELVDKKGKVNLFTRPRRFGKSLNISMLQYFFEKTDVNRAHLFDNLKIVEAGERYTSEMGRYPVIKLTLKSVDEPTYEKSLYRLKEELAKEFKRHKYLMKSTKLDEMEKETYRKIVGGTAITEEYVESLRLLSECLESHYNAKTIILIDEYDVPLEKAYFKGFYKDMSDTVRSMMNMALKTNDSLHFAVLTGCLRISKESIFTGLNNLNVVSILSNQYSEYYGFTEEEVGEALSYYGLESKKDEIRKWYNGYLFGNTVVYNPWSVIQYLNDNRDNPDCFPTPYWSNTSSNGIIRELIALADDETKGEIEELVRGGSVTKPIHEDVVYGEIKESMDNLWNFLFFTGYLKKTDEKMVNRIRYFSMAIPNEEVLYIYERKIMEWFREKTSIGNPSVLMDAIKEKDAPALMRELNQRLMDVISFHDSKEAFYHGFLLGILSNVKGYVVKSNREAGKGRTDIYVKTLGSNYGAAVFEIKVAKKRGKLEESCKEALDQIERKKYVHDLEVDGYKDVMRCGVAFYGKECFVMVE